MGTSDSQVTKNARHGIGTLTAFSLKFKLVTRTRREIKISTTATVFLLCSGCYHFVCQTLCLCHSPASLSCQYCRHEITWSFCYMSIHRLVNAHVYIILLLVFLPIFCFLCIYPIVCLETLFSHLY